MSSRNILMPVRTVATWGGVHEYATAAAAALVEDGNSVTIAGDGDNFQAAAENVGANFFRLNWDRWKEYTTEVSDSGDFDLIYSHSPQGRMLGMDIKNILGIEHAVAVHGAYHDYMYSWSSAVDSFIAVSPALVHFTQRFGRVAPWKVGLVSNGVDDSAFSNPIVGFEDRFIDGAGHIVLASRLERDKIQQLDSLVSILQTLRTMYPKVKWQIDVLGDGTNRPEYERYLVNTVALFPGVSFKMHGWVLPSVVTEMMDRAVVAIAAGRSALRAIASGTLCLSVGARGSVGLQSGNNLRAGLWSNFGDHGTFRFKPSSVNDDLLELCRPGVYEEATSRTRRVVERTHKQSVVNERLLATLHC